VAAVANPVQYMSFLLIRFGLVVAVCVGFGETVGVGERVGVGVGDGVGLAVGVGVVCVIVWAVVLDC
jgi:hypothetical protein